MIQELFCHKHEKFPYTFINIKKSPNSGLVCTECLQEGSESFILIPTYKLRVLEEKTLLQNWPPFCEQKYDSIQDIRCYIRQFIEDEDHDLKKVNLWFDSITEEINQLILQRKKEVLKQVEQVSQLKQQILSNYFKYSQNLKLKELIELNLPAKEIDNKIKDFINSVYEQSSDQTKIFQNMLSYHSFISNEMFDEYYREKLLEDILKTIDKIQFFDKSIADIDFSEQNFCELFSNQDQYNSFRKIVENNFSEYFPDKNISEDFMKDQDNQLSEEIAITPSPSLNCNLNENFKFTFKKLKYYDIQISKFSNNLSFYFQKELKPQYKYVFRVQSQEFLSEFESFRIGLIKNNNINRFDFEVFVSISASNNSLANTNVEELEFRINFSFDSFEVWSYPQRNFIQRKKIKNIFSAPENQINKQQVQNIFGPQQNQNIQQQQSNQQPINIIYNQQNRVNKSQLSSQQRASSNFFDQQNQTFRSQQQNQQPISLFSSPQNEISQQQLSNQQRDSNLFTQQNNINIFAQNRIKQQPIYYFGIQNLNFRSSNINLTYFNEKQE